MDIAQLNRRIKQHLVQSESSNYIDSTEHLKQARRLAERVLEASDYITDDMDDNDIQCAVRYHLDLVEQAQMA